MKILKIILLFCKKIQQLDSVRQKDLECTLKIKQGYIANDYNALTNSDFESTDNWYLAEVTPRETSEDNTSPYTTATSAISLNDSGNVEFQGIGGEPVEQITESESETEESEYTGDTYSSVVTETEENGVVEVTDAHGNVMKTMQGLVTREYERVYASTEATESEGAEEDDDTFEDETEETLPCNKYVYQTVPVNKANVSFNISGTAKAKSVPLSNENRTFGIALKIKYEGDSDFTEQHYQEFNYATTAKQGVCLTVSPENSNKIIETVAFAFVYGYNKNTMTVSNAMLNFAYDITTGNNDNTYTESTEDDGDDSTDENDYLDEELLSEVVITNDENHKYMYSGTTYDSTGNLVTSQTDEAGNTTSYGYDGLGNQTSVTDAKGNTTSYSYDKLGNLTSIVSGDASNTYTYDDQFRLSSISHNEFAYNFNYDIYGQLIDAKVGDQSLVSYTYNYRGLLTAMTYGNGDVINYTYDNFDRVITVGRGNSVFAILTYNKKGLVSRVYDDELYESTYYDYDIHGNLISKISTNWNNDFAYGMSTDKDGNTVEIINIEGKYTTITSGTNDNGDSFVNYHGVTVTNESDDLDRKASVITKYDNGSPDITTDDITAINTGYDYKSGAAENLTTNLVEKITHTYGADNEVEDTYQYEYDANGNITQVKNGSVIVAKYTYDSLNQLTTEINVTEDTFIEYVYDSAGNITSVKINALNDNLTKGTLQSTNTYSYDSVWKDKLSSYNGITIKYDAIGNPEEYRNGILMAWDNGRQLQSFTKDKVTTTYKYNSDGMRTYKNSSDGNTQYYYDGNNNLIALCYTPTTGAKKVLNFFYDSVGRFVVLCAVV